MFSTFLKDAIKWRVTGGHAIAMKQLGVIGSDPVNGNTALTDAYFPSLSGGINNVALGTQSLKNLVSGSNNWGVGKDSGTDAVANITTQDNVGVLGNNTTSVIYAKVALTVTSDERDKTNFQTIPWTLDMFMRVKTGAFRFMDRTTRQPTSGWRYGFSAQDLMYIEQSYVSGFNVLVDTGDPEHLKLNESMMVPILVKMVQELTTQVRELQAKLGAT